MKTAAPHRMWAAIARGTRSEWILVHTIKLTRASARTAYLETWGPAYHAEVLARVRFARVVVSLEDAAPKEQP